MTPIRGLLLAAVIVIGNASSARAIAIGFDPSASNVGVGALFDVDVVVSGLPLVPEDDRQIVSAYDLDVGYDENVISVLDVTFGLEPFPLIAGFTVLPSGVVNVLQSSLLSDDDLKALQTDTVTLFTIQFQAIAAGTSPIAFARGADDIKGVQDSLTSLPSKLPIEASTGSVDVTERVPEPGTTALILLGVVFQLVRRRRGRS